MENTQSIIERIDELTGWKIRPNRFQIHTDTTEWMNITKGNVIFIEDHYYLIRGNMKEPRFGIDDQPKYWVFSAIELDSGKEKIIKTVYDEEFTAHIGIFKIRCFRNQEKESDVLRLTQGDLRFMQGVTKYDEKGNNVRIIDYIRGKTFFHYIPGIKKDHKSYFEEDLPGILWNLYKSFLAIEFIHQEGFFHGDIRNDHIIIEAESGKYRWIDFDLNQHVSDFDLWSMGNLLSYAVGKGIHSFGLVMKSKEFSKLQKLNLRPEDSSAFYEYRIMNLEKLFPYIPAKLSRILKHFTIKPIEYYQSLEQFLAEFLDMLESEFPQ